MVRILLALDSNARKGLGQPDAMGRYPLHYAAERCTPYKACLSLGILAPKVDTLVDQGLILEEILPRFPEACQVTDKRGQLPLHILIDAISHHQSCHQEKEPNDQTHGDSDALAGIRLLLKQYPQALHQRDRRTGLYPWQQAAVGAGADLTLIYTLLRREPTLAEPTSCIVSNFSA